MLPLSLRGPFTAPEVTQKGLQVHGERGGVGNAASQGQRLLPPAPCFREQGSEQGHGTGSLEGEDEPAVPRRPQAHWLCSCACAGLVQRCVIIQKDQHGFGFTVSGDRVVLVQSVRPGERSSIRRGSPRPL